MNSNLLTIATENIAHQNPAVILKKLINALLKTIKSHDKKSHSLKIFLKKLFVKLDSSDFDLIHFLNQKSQFIKNSNNSDLKNLFNIFFSIFPEYFSTLNTTSLRGIFAIKTDWVEILYKNFVEENFKKIPSLDENTCMEGFNHLHDNILFFSSSEKKYFRMHAQNAINQNRLQPKNIISLLEILQHHHMYESEEERENFLKLIISAANHTLGVHLKVAILSHAEELIRSFHSFQENYHNKILDDINDVQCEDNVMVLEEKLKLMHLAYDDIHFRIKKINLHSQQRELQLKNTFDYYTKNCPHKKMQLLTWLDHSNQQVRSAACDEILNLFDYFKFSEKLMIIRKVFAIEHKTQEQLKIFFAFCHFIMYQQHIQNTSQLSIPNDLKNIVTDYSFSPRYC